MRRLGVRLGSLAAEAERVAPCPLTMRTHGAGEKAVLVIEPVGLAPHLGRRFYQALRASCADEGLAPRFLVVSGTQPGWVPRTPDAWPPTQG